VIKEGDKVGAISRIEEGVVYFFGWGVYNGYHIPPDFIKAHGFQVNRFRPPHNRVPKITLWNGEVVWGPECYWGAEDIIKDEIEGHQVVRVHPSVERREVRKKGKDSGGA
jgi:hypothetical protein